MIDRDRFLAEFTSELDAIDAQLDQYRRHAREKSAGGGDDPATLERRRDEIRRRSQQLEDIDGEQWADARNDLEKRRDELKASLERMRIRY